MTMTTTELYERLREKVDAVGFGFPPSATDGEAEPPEISVLKQLFSATDAEYFISMRTGYQTAEQFAAATGRDVEEAAKQLYDMSVRGLLYRRGGDQGLEYRLIPLAHGIFEFNVDDPNMLAWFAPFGQYLGMSAFMPSVTGTDTPFERTLPSRAEYVKGGILPQDDIVTLVNQMDGSFAIADCICRKPAALMGAPSPHPARTCMYTGEWADYAMENGFAEPATREQIQQVIADSEPAGRMVQALNSAKPEVICSCAGDSCLVLVQHKLGLPGPARALRSNYCLEIDRAACTDCGDCVEPCPVDALSFDSEEHLALDADMCCGCGLCIGHCDFDALALVVKDQVYAPVGGAFSSYERQAAYRKADPDQITLS